MKFTWKKQDEYKTRILTEIKKPQVLICPNLGYFIPHEKQQKY